MDKIFSLFAFVERDGFKDLHQIYLGDFSSKRDIADYLIVFFDSFGADNPIVGISKSFFSCLNKTHFFKSYKSDLGYMIDFLPSYLIDLTPVAFIFSNDYDFRKVKFFVKCAK